MLRYSRLDSTRNCRGFPKLPTPLSMLLSTMVSILGCIFFQNILCCSCVTSMFSLCVFYSWPSSASYMYTLPYTRQFLFGRRNQTRNNIEATRKDINDVDAHRAQIEATQGTHRIQHV